MAKFDFNILWVSKCTYPPKHVVKKNQHDYYQIIYVLNGDGKISIESSIYNCEKGQVYICKPDIEHKIEASKVKTLITIELKFYCNNIASKNMMHKLPYFLEDVGQQTKMSFLNIIDEISKHDNYTEKITEALFTQIILYLTRDSLNEKKQPSRIYLEKTDSCGISKIDPLNIVIDYIKLNYFTKINLNDLAEMVHLSPVYFCSIFKERCGISPIQYLQMIRHENAKRLLINSNDSITMVSEKTGFQSVHYFSRAFKNNEGITANEFRRRNQGYIIKDFRGNITDFS